MREMEGSERWRAYCGLKVGMGCGRKEVGWARGKVR
jgi:hypothetical protein